MVMQSLHLMSVGLVGLHHLQKRAKKIEGPSFMTVKSSLVRTFLSFFSAISWQSVERKQSSSPKRARFRPLARTLVFARSGFCVSLISTNRSSIKSAFDFFLTTDAAEASSVVALFDKS